MSRPVPPSALRGIQRAWRSAAEEPLLVASHGRAYLVEAPWERGDAEAERTYDEGREPAEAALRVFTQYEDAVRYCETQREERDLSEEVMHVAKVSLQGLYHLLPIIQSNSDIAFGTPVRVDLCRFPARSLRPVVIDTLVASFTTIH